MYIHIYTIKPAKKLLQTVLWTLGVKENTHSILGQQAEKVAEKVVILKGFRLRLDNKLRGLILFFVEKSKTTQRVFKNQVFTLYFI